MAEKPSAAQEERQRSYWKANQKLIIVLLAVWAFFGIVLSILLVDTKLLDFKIGQLSFGFWIAQQGSIYVFVILIFVYAFAMDKVDKKHGMKNGDE